MNQNASDFENWDTALATVVAFFHADSGTIHMLGADQLLHLKAATAGIPAEVLNLTRTIPIGKGMAGLCVERNQHITSCNIQTDTSGDIRPGAKATGMEGAIVVPIRRNHTVIGTLGIANRHQRIFTPEEIAQLEEFAQSIAVFANP